jgi:hypothetical protein
MEAKCGPLNYKTAFSGSSLLTTGVSALACGSYFGLLI